MSDHDDHREHDDHRDGSVPGEDARQRPHAGAQHGPHESPRPDAHTLPARTGSPTARWVSAASPTTTPAPAPAPASRRRRPAPWVLVTGAAAAAALVVGGTGAGAWSLGRAAGDAAVTAAAQREVEQLLPRVTGPGSSADGGATSPWQGWDGSSVQGGSGAQDGTGTQGTGTQEPATAATAEETVGVVTVDSTIGYDGSARSAGTGMVLTADGLVLTNNHVVQGSTSIAVTDEASGRTYTADVVGTDATNDVAVLQLRDASGLTPVTIDDDGVRVGDAVHGTGNAGGTGDLVTARGTVTATDESITVASEGGTGQESLSGLIQVDADVVAGDSGGPLRDADGDVVGIVTAASSGQPTVTGYAIPIDDALAIARQIDGGTQTGTVQIGLPAFLGAQVASSTADGRGVPVAGTVEGSAAAGAGLVAGDTITALDGTAVTSADALTQAIRAHGVGDRVEVSWTDASGAAHSATVVLGAGPAA